MSREQNWSAIERKAVRQRAQEWKAFRRNFLYSQQHLADAAKISKRTVAAMEAGEQIPTAGTLRKFQTLKRREEAKEHAAAERSAELEAVRAAKHDRYKYAPIYGAAQGD